MTVKCGSGSSGLIIFQPLHASKLSRDFSVIFDFLALMLKNKRHVNANDKKNILLFFNKYI